MVTKWKLICTFNKFSQQCSKKMYEDHSWEFISGYWGLKGKELTSCHVFTVTIYLSFVAPFTVLVIFLCVFILQGGMYVLQLFDTYSASGSALLWVGLFESIAIGWIYGKNLFNVDKKRLGIKFHLKICCKQKQYLQCWTKSVSFYRLQPVVVLNFSNVVMLEFTIWSARRIQITFDAIFLFNILHRRLWFDSFNKLLNMSYSNKMQGSKWTLNIYYTGGKRFYDDMENMLGFRINPWTRWCWKYITPLFCLVSELLNWQWL